MNRSPFDGLRTVRLLRECRDGCVELCREPGGALQIKTRLLPQDGQREFLTALAEDVPVRLEDGALEFLLPWRDGVPLRQWLYEQNPTLGQRRDACLSLLEQQIVDRPPVCLAAISARRENLLFTASGAFLQFIPDLGRWEPGAVEADAVHAVAGVVCEVLTADWGRQLPLEVQLLCRREKERDYTAWSQLQRDVAAVPDAPQPAGAVWRSRARRVKDMIGRYGGYAARALAVLLAVAALLSLAAAYRAWKYDGHNSWAGMYQVGDQDLRGEERGGTSQ